jgi:membrane fusion protein, macrolide-specific efflux system
MATPDVITDEMHDIGENRRAPVPLPVALPGPVPRFAKARGFFRRRLVWAGMFVLLVAGAFFISRGGQGANDKMGDSLTAKVKRGDLEVVVLETGRVEPLLQTQIKSKVGGQVIEVLVQEGEKVKKGQILLRIEATDYQRDVARTEAEISQAREAVAYAAIQLARAEKARSVSIAPAAELDLAKHEAALTRARLKGAAVALEVARDRLRYTGIQAPFDGTIVQRNVQPGEVVIPGMSAMVEGKAALVLADMSTLLVKTDLNQIDVARVKRGQGAEVTLDALPGKKFTATVTRVAPAAATVNGRDAFPVEAALAGTQDLSEIKPGMTADVRVLIEVRPKVLLLPIEAVISEKGKDNVHLLERPPGGGKPTTRLHQVKLGARNDREVEITSGIVEGAEVMIKPPAVKGDGMGG